MDWNWDPDRFLGQLNVQPQEQENNQTGQGYGGGNSSNYRPPAGYVQHNDAVKEAVKSRQAHQEGEQQQQLGAGDVPGFGRATTSVERLPAIPAGHNDTFVDAHSTNATNKQQPRNSSARSPTSQTASSTSLHADAIQNKLAQVRARLLESKRLGNKNSATGKEESRKQEETQQAPTASSAVESAEVDIDELIKTAQEILAMPPKERYGNRGRGTADNASGNQNEALQSQMHPTAAQQQADGQNAYNEVPVNSQGDYGIEIKGYASGQIAENSAASDIGARPLRSSTMTNTFENPHGIPLETPSRSRSQGHHSHQENGTLSNPRRAVSGPPIAAQAPFGESNHQTVLASTETEHHIPRNAAAYSHYFDDLDEWLELTGYHDREHRQNFLTRERRRRQLQAELNAIDQEADKVMREGSARLMPPPKAAHASPQALRSASVVQRNTPEIGAGIKRSSSFSEGRPLKHQKLEQSSGSERHRQQSAAPAYDRRENRGEAWSDSRRSETVGSRANDRPRAASDRYSPRRYENRERPTTPNNARAPAYRERAVNGREGHHDRDRSVAQRSPRAPTQWTTRQPPRPHQQPDHQPRHQYTRDANQEDPSRQYNHSSAPRLHTSSVQVKFNNDGRTRAEGKHHDGLQDSRYFVIKSWNHENVETAMRDGTWATQPHNEQVLSDAFKSVKNVILVFSVNKSMAFQGYARMESLPGTAPTPAWVKNLLWPCSPPFHIRWIRTAKTPFSKVSHLKNSYNEGQPVLIGRDGQEIEERCGRELCRLIDREAELHG